MKSTLTEQEHIDAGLTGFFLTACTLRQQMKSALTGQEHINSGLTGFLTACTLTAADEISTDGT